MRESGFRTITFPRTRTATIDLGRVTARKHAVTALLEIDVTDGRRTIRAARRSGRRISLLAWILRCIATTAAESGLVHGLRVGRRKIAIYDDVDIGLPVERVVDGTPVPIALLIERADKRSVDEISAEIERARARTIEDEGDHKFARMNSAWGMRLYYRLPAPLRLLAWRILLSNHRLRQRSMGTVMVTSLGMAGRFAGWIVPRSLHNLSFAVGTIVKKPRVMGDKVVPREIMHLTVTFDHDVIDGAPAARFVEQLVRRLEAGAELEQETAVNIT